MGAEKQIVLMDRNEIIRLPTIVGSYYKHDISVMFSDIGYDSIVIFEDKYREVKCGKGTRKFDKSHQMITIPIVTLNVFLESIQELVK